MRRGFQGKFEREWNTDPTTRALLDEVAAGLFRQEAHSEDLDSRVSVAGLGEILVSVNERIFELRLVERSA